MDPLLFYKNLADETRLKSLLLIQQEQELCVCELVTALDEVQPKISRHLAQLRKAGILQDRKQRQWVFYRLSEQLPSWAQAVLATTARDNNEYLRQARQQLLNMGERPERMRACC